MDTTVEKLYWKSKANDLLDTMTAYGMMLDKIDRHTRGTIIDAIKTIRYPIDISKYDITLPDGTKVQEISLRSDNEILINDTDLFLRDLEPYDKIRIAQGITSILVEKFS
jgi:hypothetical protein